MRLAMQQSTSCWREDKWRYGDGGQRRWRMTTVADDDNTRDWAADCDGEQGQERAVRDGGDSGVVMMAAAAADDDSKGRQRQRRTATACKIGRRPMKGMEKSGRQETAETRSGKMAAEVEDGGGRRQQWRTTTTAMADKDSSERQQWRTTTAREMGRRTTRGKEASGRRTTMALEPAKQRA
jgi:hypothetical protein